MTDHSSDMPSAWCHVDMDSLEAIYQGFGKVFGKEKDEFYITAVENSLVFFKRKNIVATYFLVAEDLDNQWKLPYIKNIIDSGHNIACHGYHHRPLRGLSKDSKYLEVILSKEKIEKELGVACSGFRAPHYSIDHETFQLLKQGGYLYDSSIYPNRKFREKLRKKHLPREPFIFFPGHVLFEVPLPYTYPYLPPFHASYSFYLGSIYFRMNINAYRRYCRQFTFLLHLTDFATPQKLKHGLTLDVFTNNFFSKQTKLQFLDRLIRIIGKYYTFTTTEDYLHFRLSGEAING